MTSSWNAELGLWLFVDRASTHEQIAARTTLSVLFVDGLCKIDLGHVGDGRKPGQHIGELFFEVLSIVSGLKGRGQFTDFLHEPHEGTGDPTLEILLVIHVADQGLEVPQVDRAVWPWGGRIAVAHRVGGFTGCEILAD